MYIYFLRSLSAIGSNNYYRLSLDWRLLRGSEELPEALGECTKPEIDEIKKRLIFFLWIWACMLARWCAYIIGIENSILHFDPLIFLFRSWGQWKELSFLTMEQILDQALACLVGLFMVWPHNFYVFQFTEWNDFYLSNCLFFNLVDLFLCFISFLFFLSSLGDPAGARLKPGSGYGYGFGIRVDSPLGPLRLEYAFNDRQAKRFHFGVGHRN